MRSLAICDALGIETSQTATLTIREPQKESDLEAEGDDSGESPATESLLKSLTPFATMSIYRVELHRYDGMAVMTHRTTFTLDGATVRRLKRLASRWKVSQAEVIRRAVAQAETQPDPLPADPVSMLRRLHESSDAIDPKRAESYLAEVYADRKRWRGR